MSQCITNDPEDCADIDCPVHNGGKGHPAFNQPIAAEEAMRDRVVSLTEAEQILLDQGGTVSTEIGEVEVYCIRYTTSTTIYWRVRNVVEGQHSGWRSFAKKPERSVYESVIRATTSFVETYGRKPHIELMPTDEELHKLGKGVVSTHLGLVAVELHESMAHWCMVNLKDARPSVLVTIDKIPPTASVQKVVCDAVARYYKENGNTLPMPSSIAQPFELDNLGAPVMTLGELMSRAYTYEERQMLEAKIRDEVETWRTRCESVHTCTIKGHSCSGTHRCDKTVGHEDHHAASMHNGDIMVWPQLTSKEDVRDTGLNKLFANRDHLQDEAAWASIQGSTKTKIDVTTQVEAKEDACWLIYDLQTGKYRCMRDWSEDKRAATQWSKLEYAKAAQAPSPNIVYIKCTRATLEEIWRTDGNRVVDLQKEGIKMSDGMRSDRDDARTRDAREESLKQRNTAKMTQEAAIPMILTCIACGARHVDEGEFATKLHHTHACQHCGCVWRPAIVHTVGVRFLPGFKDDR